MDEVATFHPAEHQLLLSSYKMLGGDVVPETAEVASNRDALVQAEPIGASDILVLVTPLGRVYRYEVLYYY